MAVVEEFHGFARVRSSDCGSRRRDGSLALLSALFDSRAAIPDDTDFRWDARLAPLIWEANGVRLHATSAQRISSSPPAQGISSCKSGIQLAEKTRDSQAAGDQRSLYTMAWCLLE